MLNVRILGTVAALCFACAPTTRGAWAATPHADCRSFAFPVYFATGSATLTPAADRVIRASAARTASCRVEDAKISIGAGEANLNQGRGAAVSTALAQAGVAGEVTHIEARRSPLHLFQRRVTVSLRMSSK